MRAIAPVTDAWQGVRDLFTALLALIAAYPLAALGIDAAALARFEQLGSPQAEEPRSMLEELGCAP